MIAKLLAWIFLGLFLGMTGLWTNEWMHSRNLEVVINRLTHERSDALLQKEYCHAYIQSQQR